VLDNLSAGKRENLAHLGGKIQFIEADLTDARAVASAVAGVDYVFHQAALASVPRSIEAPLETHAACATGTVTLLDEARKAKVRRVVYAASSSAYGDQPGSAKRETDLPAPLSPYAAAKLAAEQYCQAFYHSYGLETVAVRYFNVFGPRQDPTSLYSAVIPLFIVRMLSGKAPVIYGDGKQSRDFTYVDNIVEGNLLAAEAPDAKGRTINVANGRTTDLLTLVRLINELLGLKLSPVHEPVRVGDVRDSLADITVARAVLGYEPKIDFEEGLRRSVDYYRSLASH
jgi:UDP-glucose 4-epimerase